MITSQKIMTMLTGRESVDAFLAEMIAGSNDFAEDYQRYEEAIHSLKTGLGKEITPSVDDLVVAIYRQTVSNSLFSGYLGFQANVDHFLNPVARTFVDVDPEIYLREGVAKALPAYASAQTIIDTFYSQLSPAQKEVFEDVIAYMAHLETVVPKAAHYYGFLLGNQLLPQIMPSYQPDMQLTLHYNMILEEFLGHRLELD